MWHEPVVHCPYSEEEGSQASSDYRPISLIDCLYKIIAKTLVARLSKVLDTVISDTQSTFLTGRLILDGVVILNEIVDEAKKEEAEQSGLQS